MKDKVMARKLPKKQLIDIMYKEFNESVDFGRLMQAAISQQKLIDIMENHFYVNYPEDKKKSFWKFWD